jgi:hypothetical protein
VRDTMKGGVQIERRRGSAWGRTRHGRGGGPAPWAIIASMALVSSPRGNGFTRRGFGRPSIDAAESLVTTKMILGPYGASAVDKASYVALGSGVAQTMAST